MVDELKAKDRKNAKASPMGGVQHVSRSGEKGWNDDNFLSSLAVSPSNYEIFDFNTIDSSPVFVGRWGKVDCSMLEQLKSTTTRHFPTDSHRGFYFPPTCVGPPLSPERENAW